MRRRLIFLFMFCLLLIAVHALPKMAISTFTSSEYLIWVDMSAMTLTLYRNGQKTECWPIAVGTDETPTPIGVFRITHRFVTPAASEFGTRFIALNVPWGQYAIHGTNKPGSIGSHASEGCVRMFSRDVERLYKMVPDGTTVVIEDGPYGGLGWSLQRLTSDMRGNQVLEAQKRLRTLGYYTGALDGIYGKGMTAALEAFKLDMGIPWEDCVDEATWDALGVLLFE